MKRIPLIVLSTLLLSVSALAQNPAPKSIRAVEVRMAADTAATIAGPAAGKIKRSEAKAAAGATTQDPDQDPDAGPETTEDLMKGVNRSFRGIRRFLRKPEGDAPLDDVRTMQVLALKAKLTTPSLAATLADDEKAQFLQGYRKDMNMFLRHLLDLEDAMVEGDWDASAKIAEQLNEGKKAGHNAYKGKDEDKKK